MVDGLEEGKSQDVVQMGMGEKDVIVKLPLSEKPATQSSDSGPCVNNNDLVILASCIEAGGIAAVFDVFFA